MPFSYSKVNFSLHGKKILLKKKIFFLLFFIWTFRTSGTWKSWQLGEIWPWLENAFFIITCGEHDNYGTAQLKSKNEKDSISIFLYGARERRDFYLDQIPYFFEPKNRISGTSKIELSGKNVAIFFKSKFRWTLHSRVPYRNMLMQSLWFFLSDESFCN